MYKGYSEFFILTFTKVFTLLFMFVFVAVLKFQIGVLEKLILVVKITTGGFVVIPVENLVFTFSLSSIRKCRLILKTLDHNRDRLNF